MKKEHALSLTSIAEENVRKVRDILYYKIIYQHLSTLVGSQNSQKEHKHSPVEIKQVNTYKKRYLIR